MDYKEKYEIAVKAAMLAKQDTKSAVTIGILEEIFPELRESDDERIRKELLNAFQEAEDSLYMVLTPHKRESFIAWLEKQGKNNMGISEATKQKLEDNLNKALEKETPESWNEFLEKQGEQKPRYSIGDVLCDKSCTTLNKGSQSNFEITDIRNGMYICDKCSFPISQQDEYELVAKRIESVWSEEDESNLQGIIDEIKANKNYASAYDLATYNRFLSWLEYLKNRVQPMQEWSEEDMKVIKEIIFLLKHHNSNETLTTVHSIEDMINWLKSLKPQNTWKPSDEQMKALEHFVRSVGESGYASPYDNNTKLLYSLLADLKKLREE